MENKQSSLASAARRDLGRLRKVSATIVRHGFGELLLKTPLGRRLHSRGDIEVDGATIQGTAAVRFTQMLASLGPTFIKLGQILSMRQDLFPREWTTALASLQDKAPVVPVEQIRLIIEEALGMPLSEAFASFEDKPVGTASIAQVHLATTHEGERVVVKVQRPGIESTMRGDLNLLYLGAQVLEASIDELRLVGITDIVVEFERALLRELDFREELSNLIRMRSLLDPKRKLTVPQPYPELSEKTVLTMTFFAGRPLRALEPASALAKHAVDEVVHALCKQVFVDGFFHGDPHAGNILCDEDGRVCMLDLGLVGALTNEQRSDVVSLLVATFANDSSSIARILLKMGTPTQRVNLMELRAEIERIRNKYIEDKDIDSLDTSGFVQEFADAAQKFRIKLASEYAILIKSVATVEGIVRNLDPGADIVAIARPYVTQTLVHRFSPGDLLREVASEMTTIGSLAHRLPTHIDQLLQDFETGNLQLRAVTPKLDRLPWVLQQSVSRLSLSMFATTMSLCSAMVLTSVMPRTPRLVLGVALALASAVAWIILLGWHFVRGSPLKLTPLLRLFRRR
ncbi:MAG: Ubiquinone biosynthesis monooxygenase UbiB [Myxococcaceae bacterium]|nr:Ubiquinone biosynthesis monooxygenase UbiB [Myxococcaceae bacterium]